jgi:predicted dehydrogenase
MIGVRGHNNYVFGGFADNKEDQIVAISTTVEQDSIEKLRAGAAKVGQSPREFTNWRQMLDEARPEVISVAGPLFKHAEICIEAFSRGIHVFCEKPVVTTLEDFARVKDAYGKSRVCFAAMMGIRYEPAFMTAWKAVKAGAVGEPRILDGRKSYKCGRREDFFKKRATYGGTIPWVGSHAIDWVQWFSGQRFTAVYATHSTMHNRGHDEMEMTAMCLFEMTNEVMATVSIDYLRPDNAPTHGDDRIRCAGTEGVIEVRGGQVYLINGTQKGEQTLECSTDRQVFRDFLEECKGRGRCLITAKESLDITEACLLAVKSADEHRRISFAD